MAVARQGARFELFSRQGNGTDRPGQSATPLPWIAGAVLIFERGPGGLVGFAVGQDDNAIHVLGGNQSNAVPVARVAKSRLPGARWPVTYPPHPQRLPTLKPGELLATSSNI